jgi:hypothetical protein
MGTVRRGSTQAAVERRPAHAAGVPAERDRADPAHDDLGGRLDPAFAQGGVADVLAVLLVVLLERAAQAVRERTAHTTEDTGLHDRLGVEAVPVSLDDLDELGEHVLEDLFGRFLSHFRDELREMLQEDVFDLLDGEPAKPDDLGNELDGERIGQRPDDVGGRHRHRDEHRVLGVLDAQRLITQGFGLRLGFLDEIALKARELRGVVLEVFLNRAANVVDDLPAQFVETLARRLDLLGDGVPLVRQRPKAVLVALRPRVARDDVEDPVEARIDVDTHRAPRSRASVGRERFIPAIGEDSPPR